MKKATGYVKDLQDWLTIRNYSKATISAYGGALRQFLDWRRAQGMGVQFTQEEARCYILHRYDQGRKWQTINGDYTAIKKFYEHVLNQGWNVDHLPRPRKERSLPAVLSASEVGRLIGGASSLKHQVFIILLYSTGLRLSEALGLELSHIDGERHQIRVVKGKGAKDRYVGIPEELLFYLRAYYRSYRPVHYLFNGKKAGSVWAKRSAQHALEQARIRAGIKRSVSPHVLRHCYATHHLEHGTNLIYLKEQLGHKNLKTTARYIHLCVNYQNQVCHPINQLQIQLKVTKVG